MNTTCEEACEKGTHTKKYWPDANNDEKIERLRNEIKKLQDRVRELAQYISVLKSHEHSTTGKSVLMNIHDFDAKDHQQIDNPNGRYYF